MKNKTKFLINIIIQPFVILYYLFFLFIFRIIEQILIFFYSRSLTRHKKFQEYKKNLDKLSKEIRVKYIAWIGDIGMLLISTGSSLLKKCLGMLQNVENEKTVRQVYEVIECSLEAFKDHALSSKKKETKR